MIRRLASLAGPALLWLAVSAHVGSPDAWFQGAAGAYRVVVRVVPAGVVPGVATVEVRVLDDGVGSVGLQTTKFDATGGTPPPEPAVRSSVDPGLWTGKLWVMTSGSNSVIVQVAGSRGTGTATVPVVVVPTSRLEFGGPMATILGLVGIFLLVGLVTIVGASYRESTLEPGQPSTEESRRRARRAMTVASVIVAVSLFGGWKWWTFEDGVHVGSMFKPLSAIASIEGDLLELTIDDSAWVNRNDTVWLASRGRSRWSPLISDHGKIMHLFAIRDDMSAFAHLHPRTIDSATFTVGLPRLPGGRYRVFADIVHESGFAQTIVASADRLDPDTAAQSESATSPDDSWFIRPASGNARRVVLDDGATMEWIGAGSVRAGVPVSLTFDVRDSTGAPASLEPYMGMAGHAVVQRDDGSVFVHLHPMGTISMASRMAFEMRAPGDTIAGELGKRMTAMQPMEEVSIAPGPVSFPYAFPRAGNYRLWIQVKRAGKILTGSFDVSVAEPLAAN